MKRKSFIIMLTIFLTLTSIAPAFAGTAEDIKYFFVDGKLVMHKEASAPPIVLRDPIVPWTENVEMTNYTSDHVQIWTKAYIASGIAFITGGGTAAFWTGLAGGIFANAKCAETKNVYYTIKYYWQPSYIDPQLPYYIKQVIYAYEDLNRSKAIGYQDRYYYSNMTF